jgi:hypothetical protein
MLLKKIREIAKKAEGNSDCFATTHVNMCNQMNCLWREDCKAEVAA